MFLYNKNPRELLAKTASKIYSKKPNNLIAVTGTNGKSSIVNFFYQIMKLNKKPVSSIGTLGIVTNKKNIQTNNTTLDSVTLNKFLAKLKINKINNVILEASSHGLKQHRLDGLKFDLGIFTNLSRDHLDYHKSYKDYLNSKLILFKHLMKKNAKIVFDNDIEQSKLIKKICAKKKIKSLTIGKNNSDLKLLDHKYIGHKQKVTFSYKNKIYYFETNLIGKIQINNLFMAILAALESKIQFKKIISCVNKIKSINGRMEEVGKIKNNSKVILDYAHTPDALEVCLRNIKEQFKYSKIKIVFGCGGDRDKPKRKIMGKIANKYCEKIFITDDNPRTENPKIIRNQIKKYISKKNFFDIASREKAIEEAIKSLKSGEILVVAGKGHENYQEYKKRRFFSDKKYILKYINLKNKKIYNDWKLNIISEKINIKNFNKKLKINSASINSKEINKNDIFVGIKGKKKDGNKFANDAIKNGASIALVQRNYLKRNKRKIKINNTYNFLKETSKLIRKTSPIIPIAVTGSSGKTSVKDLLGKTLNKLSATSYSKKSFNNKYGVPLSLYNIKKNDKFGVFEVGMDKKGEINNLTKLILPNVGLITNVSYAHIKNFKNLKGIASAKSEIMNNIHPGGIIVLNKDDKFYDFFINKAKQKKLKITSFSMKNNADISFKKMKKINKNYYLFLKIRKKIKKFKLKESIKSYIPNILAVVAVISNFYNFSKIKENIFYNYNLINGRGDIFKLKIKNKIINIVNESYNSNPLSLKFALNNFEKMNIKSNLKNLLLGDMLELGRSSKMLHKEIAKMINQSKVNKVYVFGKHIRNTFNKIKTQKKGIILNNKEDIKNLIMNKINSNEYLMVKASNGTGLFNMISKMKSKGINAI